MVDGLRCAACVWLVEEVLNRQPGVEARLSYGSGQLWLHWDEGTLDEHLGTVQSLGYRVRPLGTPESPDRDLLVRFGVAAFLAVNVMVLHGVLYLGWVEPIAFPFERFFRWLALLLATPAALWSAEPFHRRAWAGLRQGVLHMDLPVSLAVGLLYAHGVWATFTMAEAWLDSVAMLVALLLGGRLLEHRGRRRAHDAARSLAARVPGRARLADTLEEVEAPSLLPGQRVEVAAGEELPADGCVVRGQADVDLALLTGESEPRLAMPGDDLPAGAVLRRGHLVLEVLRAGDETLLSRMAQQLRVAPDVSEESDRIAPWFTAGTLVAAMAAGLLHGQLDAVAAVLVVACPCALALAGPLATAAGLGAAARRGLLLSGAEALDRLSMVRRVVLDKTGTLTDGVPTVVQAEDEPLRLAAGLERASVHPVARALRAEAISRGLPLPTPERVIERPGVGLSGVVEGQRLRLRSGGPDKVLLEREGGMTHTLQLEDRLRSDSSRVVASLHSLGLETVLLTGDREEVAHRIGLQAGVETVFTCGPQEKAGLVEADDLFVGDGLNDALALSRAGVGLAMREGAAPALHAADGVIAAASLEPVVAGIVAAREARRARTTSRRRAVAYNLVAVSAALAGLVNPLVAAVLMPLSSLLVVLETAAVEGRVTKFLLTRCS